MLRVVVIAGGYRSGSTLQYNLLGEYVEHAGFGRRGGYVNPDEADAFVASLTDADGLMVVKCHQVTPSVHGFERPAAWADHVRAGTAVAVTTRRETAATERSMCRKFAIPPEDLHDSVFWRENEANVAAWAPMSRLCQQYDDLTGHPKRALRALLRLLELPIHRASVRHACAATSKDVVRSQQAGVPKGEWDPVTLVHWDHIADDGSATRRR